MADTPVPGYRGGRNRHLGGILGLEVPGRPYVRNIQRSPAPVSYGLEIIYSSG
jgi:hypothetical protein